MTDGWRQVDWRHVDAIDRESLRIRIAHCRQVILAAIEDRDYRERLAVIGGIDWIHAEIASIARDEMIRLASKERMLKFEEGQYG